MASSSNHKSYQYDVFLSFSGEDTRRTFIDHLYAALQQQGIQTFKDDERLEKGKRINDKLLKSIEDSRFYIIVFSKNYASSSWCLNELVKIMECQKTNKHIAYPVFYDVDPSEVRQQHGSVGKALAVHRNDLEVEKWREALKEAANLCGWDVRKTADGHEAKVIKFIVEQVSIELRSININVDRNLIGMECRMQDLKASLQMGSNDVRMIGIKGMGGAGKTTLARAIFDNISINFEAKCFIENVREVSKASLSSLMSLQKQVLSDLLMNNGKDINSVHEAKITLKGDLFKKRVLLVLDDVDHKDQLEALAGQPDWYQLGSRVIITTRDEQVLIAHRVKSIHDVNLLSDMEAIRLFSRHAFGKDIPIREYVKQSVEVVRYAAGLPLTIEVLGSFLCGEDKLEWIDALARLKTIPLKETLDKLELSYESLEDDYKEIFLDVACLLKGWMKDSAIKMLESCGFHARNGLKVLEQRSLINSNGKFIDMHDHLEEMGKNIVRRLHPNDPNKHSRLWVQEEIDDVLANDWGTEATRCIHLKVTPEMVVKGLGNMKRLRCLIVNHRNYNNSDVDYVKTNEICQYFPNALRYLSWEHYRHWCLPKTFEANNLIALKMYGGELEQLWEGGKVMKKLKSLELIFTKLKTIDFGLIPNLESLDLQQCHYLEEVHVPVGGLKSLVYLNLSDCKSLQSLSFIKKLESLQVFHIGEFLQWEFPDIFSSGHFNDSLLELDISDSRIKEIPSSIGNLRKLVYLNLSGCRELKSLARSFCSLQNLTTLDLISSGIEELPDNIGHLACLEELDLRSTNVKNLPDSICMLKHLKILILRSCQILEKLPQDLGQLDSLEVLDTSFCWIRDIPSSICMLKHLKRLKLEYCHWIKKLPEGLGDLECLEELNVTCTGISHLPQSIALLKGLKVVGFELNGQMPEDPIDKEPIKRQRTKYTLLETAQLPEPMEHYFTMTSDESVEYTAQLPEPDHSNIIR